jgi:hypothetical protein
VSNFVNLELVRQMMNVQPSCILKDSKHQLFGFLVLHKIAAFVITPPLVLASDAVL